ncbi:uncharacterized protein N7515_004719 [Penicillium bovifimosum]|uniref:DUF1754-domain-containing protein n=1 Tax=Penicillium bovifimosum TaxID=126998 RepID=A0A9W9H240_9EURO|nr:uncharacterized protein N7515_004719 [Penicillium bovifimosum]KAJ5135441.1 hypothetical protein N7515_004719 [Penicillium bovifimosum]
MAGDEYSVGGGKLKLKGSKVSSGRVEKKKKKSSSKKKEEGLQSTTGTPDEGQGSEREEKGEGERVRSEERSEGDMPAKTEAERKAEEIRRKRMHERLQREGIKTHKERVEELNKYLSRLSEHHDMPKIGPG